MKIIEKIKNLSLEQINKNLLFIAILSLLFRSGNFITNYIPKPFEIIFTLIVLLTIIDIIVNKKFNEFFLSIPKNIKIALFCLNFSILFGWVFATFFLKIPFYFNMVLEFGTYIISVGIFLLILFYTRNDQSYIKKYFYALFIPIVYIICILFPEIANYFNLTNSISFLGFTPNPNIISKILLIPVIFFIIKTLFEEKSKWFKLIYFFVSFLLISLLFWTSSRGAILSSILGAIFILFIFSFNNFNWRKLFSNGIIIFLIFLIGFILVPQKGKLSILNRTFNIETNKFSYSQIKDESIKEILNKSSKPRIQIWSFYLNKVLINPIGFGPNTHMPSYILNNVGLYDNTGPHNSFLQIWLWGGLLGILSFIYILINAFKNLKIKLKTSFNSITVALIVILFTLSISIMFDDSLSLFPFWVILALSLKI